jgi:hypothetical protein
MTFSATKRSSYLVWSALFCVAALAAPWARGASITWDTPTQISGDSDVSTTGTLVGAANVGDTGVPAATVNGVTFQSLAAPGGVGSSGNFTMSSSGFGVFQSNTGGGSPNAPFNTLGAGYQTLLSSYIVPLFSTATLTISGLTSGDQYQFEFWSNNSSDSNSYQITATAGNSIMLGSNDDHAVGGLGEFVTGTFTADSNMQSIDFIGDGDGGFLNGFQLRSLPAVSAVPDSGSTLVLFSIAAIGLFFLRGKQRACSSHRR